MNGVFLAKTSEHSGLLLSKVLFESFTKFKKLYKTLG